MICPACGSPEVTAGASYYVCWRCHDYGGRFGAYPAGHPGPWTRNSDANHTLLSQRRGSPQFCLAAFYDSMSVPPGPGAPSL